MREFWIRFILFSLIWIIMIVDPQNELVTASLLLFTSALVIFFFLSYQNASVYLYFSLACIVVSHSFIIGEVYYSLLLLFFITIFSSFRLHNKHFYLFVIGNFILSLLITYINEASVLKASLLSIGIVFILLKINQLANDRKEQQEIYQQLLAEYRQTKRLHVSAEREARLAERTRIARELHDSVGHRLTALIMQLEMLAIQEPNKHYRQLKEMADESLAETREAVQALQTTDIEGIAAVVQLIRKLEAESQLLVQFTLKQGVLTIPLSNKKSVVFYRVIQEALTNVMRHSTSKEVQIILEKSAIGSLAFTISNPVSKAKAFDFGFGLKHMQKRLIEVGGHVDIYQIENKFVVNGTIPDD